LITYTPKNQKNDGLWRAVDVKVPDGFRARTRNGYFAPAPAPIRPTIEFTVMDDAHRYIEVTKDDFDVYEDDTIQTVDTFQEAVDPVSIVLAIDESGSMKLSTELVKQTAKDFVRAVRPEDSLALITFADKPKFAHVLSLNRQWSLEAIDGYAPRGGTALYDAIWNSLQHLKGVPGRHAVVVLTDGRDEDNPGTAPGSTHTLEEVLALEKQAGATIFVVGLGAKVDKAVIEKLAVESGGQTYYASDASALGDQFHQVVEDLRRRYVLSYVSSNSTHDGAWRTLDIRPRLPGYVVLSGGGYFSPEE
ncbi:MAG: VWA domain-containing protein, partial [Acidobacteriaceae bacterium]|nr:VWA domain-containing protein [Acidobacteriaceae bacterium]